jgi:hypothetical protein
MSSTQLTRERLSARNEEFKFQILNILIRRLLSSKGRKEPVRCRTMWETFSQQRNLKTDVRSVAVFGDAHCGIASVRVGINSLEQLQRRIARRVLDRGGCIHAPDAF